jgi:predicted N-acetyltransferase YhbS
MLAELAVDPEYQRRGLGRQLLAKAYDATPRGELSIIAPAGTGPFFEAVGAERAVASFVMRRSAKAGQ